LVQKEGLDKRGREPRWTCAARPAGRATRVSRKAANGRTGRAHRTFLRSRKRSRKVARKPRGLP